MVGIQLLNAIHTHVTLAGRDVLAIDTREGDIPAAVQRPTFQDGQQVKSQKCTRNQRLKICIHT